MSQIAAIDIDFDACDATTMRAHLVALYNAILRLMAGNQRIRVRHMERWTEWQPGSAQALKQLYESLCELHCEASQGLPRFSSRGGPAYGRFE